MSGMNGSGQKRWLPRLGKPFHLEKLFRDPFLNAD